MLSSAMSDQDILGTLIINYEPRIQNSLLSAKLISTKEAFAFLTKLRSLENSREQYRSARWDVESQDQNRRIPRNKPIDSTGNRRPCGSVQVPHVRRNGWDMKLRGDSMINP
jgi:hypothetical protein